MATYDAGDASINIRPSLKGFVAELEADLKKIDAQLGVAVHSDIARAKEELAAWRAQEERNSIDIPVNVDTNSVQRASREMGKLVEAGKALSALKWNAGALGLGSLPAMGTALAAVAGSLQQVSQAGLAMPGVFAGVLSSAGTAKLAVSGVSDAFKAVVESSDGSAASIEKANTAMAQLAPNARAFVTALAGIKPEFDELQGTVQNNFFAGLDDSVKDLTGKQLPTLKAGLGGISTALNQNLKQLAASAGSESSQGLLGRILGNTGDAQSRLTKAIDPLVHALGTLTAAGSDTLPKMADGVGALADRFNQFITTADADGRLDKWINEGIDGVEHLGSIVLDLGKSFAAITKAAGGGEGLLAILDQGAAKLATFLNSAEGQDKLTRFFNEGKQQLGQWLPILQNLVPIFGGVYNAAKQWTDALLPPLQAITGVLADHPRLIQAVAEMFVAWKTINGVTSLLGSLGLVSKSLRTDVPAAARDGAAGINSALAMIVVPEIGKQLNDQIQQWLKDNHPRLYELNNTNTPDQLGQKAREWVDRNIFGEGRPAPTNGVPQGPLPGSGNGPHGSGQRLSPADIVAPPAPGGQQASDPYGLLPPGYDKGGPTPSGRGPGPSGGWLAELHGDEWVLPAHARAAVGDQALWALTQGRKFDQGGYVDPYGNPVTPGGAPGPGTAAPSIAPNPYAGGGLAGLFGSLVSGLQGPIALGASLANLGGQAGAEGAIPGQQTQHGVGTILPAGGAAPLSLADRAAGIPGLWGLVGSLGSSNPAQNLMAWGEQTGQWLGNFTARTVGSFATSLWKGALGIFGLENSILSPDNPWNLAGQSVGQFAFGSEGPLGKMLGANPGAGAASSGYTGASKAPTEKQLREAGQKVTRADQRVAEIQQRIAELPKSAKESQRTSLANDLANAQQDAADARSDIASLQSGGTAVRTAGAFQTGQSAPAGTGAERWRPAVRQALATYGAQFGITNMSAWENAMVRQLATESGGDPNAYNGNDSNGRGGRQVVQGIGQFLRSTFDANNITGGAYLDPYAQIAAMIPYVAKKYGTDASGAPLQIGRGVGYAAGGPTPPGRTTAYPAILHGDEFVISARGRARVPDSFLHALNQGAVDPGSLPQFLNGGDPALALLRNPTPPRPQIPDIKPMTPRPAAGAAPAQVAPRPAPAPGPAPAAPAAPQPGEPAPAQQQGGQSRIGGPGPGSAPSQLNHNLPWIDTAIDSTASTLGNIAATAISMGAAGGSGGMGGGAGAGLASSMAAGLFQQGGKIAKNVVNVFSSALVGNLGDNTTSGAYGAPLLSAPPQPARSIDARTMFGDVSTNDPRDFVEKQRLYEQQRSQTMVDYV